MSNEAKCSCQFCNGHIAFDAVMVGQVVVCPHCGMETKLFTPPLQKQALPPPLKSQAQAVKAAVPKTSIIKLPSIKLLSSQTLAIFFMFTTFCLASVLFWEHQANPVTSVSKSQTSSDQKEHFQNPTGAKETKNENQSSFKSSPAATKEAPKIQGSDTITVWWGNENINRVRLDEANFERNGGVFYVRLKSTGKLVGQVSGAEAEKVQAYLYGK